MEDDERLLYCQANFSQPKNFIRNTYPGLAYTYIILMCSGFIYIAISLASFFYFRRSYMRLKKRNASVPVMIVIGAASQLISSTYHIWNELPSVIVLLTRAILLPGLAIPILIRLLDYYNRFVLAQTLLDSLKARATDNGDEVSVNESNQNKVNQISTWRVFVKTLSHLAASKNPTSKEVSPSTAIVPSNGNNNQQVIDQNIIKMLKFFTSGWVHAIIFIILSSPMAFTFIYEVTSIPCLKWDAMCYGCPLPASSVVIYAVGFLVVALSLFFAYLVRKYPDPFGVLRETKYYTIFGALPLLTFFVLKGRFPEGFSPYFGFSILMHFSVMIMVFVSNDLQVYIAWRENNMVGLSSKKQISRNGTSSILKTDTSKVEDIASGTPDGLRKLLSIPKELELFEQHLVSEFAVETISMYVDCERFTRTFFDMNENTRKVRAKRIALQYVDDNAAVQVNLPFSIRSRLIKNINGTTPIDADVFKEAQREVFGMLVGSYLRYIKSKQFQENHP